MGLHVENLTTFVTGCRVMAWVGISGWEVLGRYPYPFNHQATLSMGRGSPAIRCRGFWCVRFGLRGI